MTIKFDQKSTFSDYQKLARTTAIYPNVETDLVYPVLGLASESGEVASKLKKIIRDKGGILTEEDKQAIAAECADCGWYIANILTTLGFDFQDIAKANLEKLFSRKERNVLSGSGDNR